MLLICLPIFGTIVGYMGQMNSTSNEAKRWKEISDMAKI